MAVVKGPLFSLDAAGTIGRSVVFSKWKGRNYVRRHAVPANPKSSSQVSVRAAMTFLSQYWDSLNAGEQSSWDDRAAATKISPFNAFVSYNLDRWGRYLAASKSDPALEVNTPGTVLAPTATAGIRSISIDVPISVLNDNWGVYVYASLVTGFTPSRTNCRAILPAESVATFTWLDFPLTPGVEVFYRFGSFSDDGVASLLAGEQSATPTT
jgi:hypothetical protein